MFQITLCNFKPHLKYLSVALCFKIESTVVLFLLQIHLAAYHAENMKEVNIHESTELQPRKSRVIHSLDHKGNYCLIRLNKKILVFRDKRLIAQDNAGHLNFVFAC